MKESGPSRTANRVAMRRAAHQLLDHPKVLDDPLALRILSSASRAQLNREASNGPGARFMRAFVVARARFAEDELSRAVKRGASQYVVLGAGLDMFGCRNPYPALRVFEVDHPATQVWKRERLDAAGIKVPASITFAPFDFEKQTLSEGLRGAGFDSGQITFFSWLGVVMYLTEDAAMNTLKFVAATPAGGGLVFDYAVPRASLKFVQRIAFDRLSRRVKAVGEPFQLFFTPSGLSGALHDLGFRTFEDLGMDEINARYFAGRSDRLRVGGGLARLMSAEL